MTQAHDSTLSPKGTHLTPAEMHKIEAYKAEGYSNRQIAKLLGRCPQTIHNAIKTGSVPQKRQQKHYGKTYTYYDTIYFADVHAKAYQDHRRHCGRRPKWVDNSAFLDWADQKLLQEKWSPDGVVHQAKEVFEPDQIPSTSTLYHWIDRGLMRARNGDLLEKVGRKERQDHRRGRPNRKTLGLSIEERPQTVENRQSFGHWEIDTVVGRKRQGDPVLLTLVERKTRFEKLFKIPCQSARAVHQTLQAFLKGLEDKASQVFQSITADNGSEFASLGQVSKDIPSFFCHPYASYERGSSENQHKLIRRFLPKYQSFQDLTNSQVSRIQQWMNGYPRKVLGYRSPYQAFVRELRQLG